MIVPAPEALVASSALLRAFAPELASFDPEEVAATEFAYYVGQTCAYEIVGLRFLDEMSASTSDPALLRAFADQAIDEARHVEVYRDVVAKLDALGVAAHADIAPLGNALLGRGTLAEKSVMAFCVLESLAIGIFAARIRGYRGSTIAAIDQTLLSEEVSHQRGGVVIVERFVRDGLLTEAAVMEVSREGARRVADLLVPSSLLSPFGIAPTAEAAQRLSTAGFLEVQRSVTQRALVSSVRAVRRGSRGCRADGAGEVAA